MKLDFSKARPPIRVNFRPCIYLRDRTHSYLWLRDIGEYGYFLTMDSGMIEVVKLEIINGSYRLYENKQSYWDLEPSQPYPLEKAVRMYFESTLNRTESAQEEMLNILGLSVPKRSVMRPQNKPTKPVVTTVVTGANKSLSELCHEVGISPSDARKKLRGKIEKPGSRWEWSNGEEISRVLSILRS